MRTSAQLVTAGQEINLKFGCTNESDKAIKNFSFGIEVPDGITVTDKSPLMQDVVTLEAGQTIERTLRVKIAYTYPQGIFFNKRKDC